MKLTIIPEDNVVIIDGVSLPIALDLDPNYHAIQWNGEKGVIETKKGDNIFLDNLGEFAGIIEKHSSILAQINDKSGKPTENDVSAIRDKHLYGGITVGEIEIGTDNLTQQRIMAARIMAKENPDYFLVKWKVPSGFVQLDAEEIILIADEIREHVQACFEAEERILFKIDQYETIAAMEEAYAAALSDG